MGNSNPTEKTPEFLKAAANFSNEEINLLRMIYKDLSDRSGMGISKEAFLSFFPLTGLWGEKVWKEFDVLNIGHIDFGLFIIGLNKFCKCDEEQKVRFLFTFYDGDKDGYIDKEDFLQMLCNYSKQDVNTITNDIVQKVQEIADSSQLAIPLKANIGDKRDSVEVSVEKHVRTGPAERKESMEMSVEAPSTPRRRRTIQLDGDRTVEVILPAPRGTSSRNSSFFDAPDETSGNENNMDQIKREMSFHQFSEVGNINLKAKPVVHKPGHMVNDQPMQVIHYTRVEKSNTKKKEPTTHVYSSAFNFQMRIRDYASAVLRSAGGKGKNKLNMEEFREWIKQHPVILKLFSDSFHSDVWSTTDATHRMINPKMAAMKSTKSSSTICEYTTIEPLVSSAIFKRGRKVSSWKQRYAELRGEYLFYYVKKGDRLPKGLYYLGGIFVEPLNDFAKAKKYGVQISHKNACYPSHKIYFPTKEEFELWMMHFKARNVTSIEELFELQEKIGEGKFSVVYRALDKKLNNREVAVKVINKSKLTDSEREFLISETAIMKLLSHPHIIKLYETIETRTHIYIVTELVKGGDLQQYTSRKRFLDEYEANIVMSQLFEAFVYLQSMCVIHRDIKAENIMVTLAEGKDEIVSVKIIDFGFATIHRPDEALYETCGTPNYIAPEVLLNVGYTHKVDNFSLGVILYYMIRGKLPFNGITMDIVLRNTLVCEYNMVDMHWANISKEAKDLINKLLKADPAERIELEEAHAHEWIKLPNKLKELIGANRENMFS